MVRTWHRHYYGRVKAVKAVKAKSIAEIEVTEKPLPGHGRQKWIRAASAAIDLVARV